jgi:hypothetical protein
MMNPDAMTDIKSMILLSASWGLSVMCKVMLGIDVQSVMLSVTITEVVGVLSGLGSLGLTLVTGWHYILKIREMKRKRKG